MSVFTERELDYLTSQRLARIATASATGQPEVQSSASGSTAMRS